MTSEMTELTLVIILLEAAIMRWALLMDGTYLIFIKYYRTHESILYCITDYILMVDFH